MTTGPKRQNFPEGIQILADDLVSAQRFSARALQRVIKRLCQDETGAIQSGVLDGLVVSAAASGSLAVDVTAGVAFLLNASGVSDLAKDSDYRWLELFAASADVTLDAADAVNPRIDRVYLLHTYGAIDTAARNIKNPSTGVVAIDPAAEVTYGPTITVAVEAGTPAGVPAAPAAPANSITLALVTVPALATVAGDLTVADGRTMLPTASVPKKLAGGTEVDGALLAESLNINGSTATITSGGAITGAGVTVTGGVVAGTDVTAGGQFKSPAAVTATTGVLLARSDASGAPAASADARVVEVERGSATNAHIAWDEGSDAWVANQGDGVGDRALLTVGAHDGTSMLHNDHLGAFFSTGGTGLVATLSGGGADETVLVDHDVTGFDLSSPLFWVGNVTGRAKGAASNSVLSAVVDFVAITATQVSVKVIATDAGNLGAGDTVTFRLMFMAPRIA